MFTGCQNLYVSLTWPGLSSTAFQVSNGAENLCWMASCVLETKSKISIVWRRTSTWAPFVYATGTLPGPGCNPWPTIATSRWFLNLVGGIPTPLKNISQVGIIIPNIWENKKCSEPPTTNVFEPSQHRVISTNHLKSCFRKSPVRWTESRSLVFDPPQPPLGHRNKKPKVVRSCEPI